MLWCKLALLRGDIWLKNGRKEGSQPNGYLGKNILGKINIPVNALCQVRDCLACEMGSNRVSVAEAEQVIWESTGKAAWEVVGAQTMEGLIRQCTGSGV